MQLHRSLFLFVATTSGLFSQEALHTSSVTLGIGGTGGGYGGPAFHSSYEYRFFKYLAGEAGVDVLLPSAPSFPYTIFTIANGVSAVYPTYLVYSQQGRNRVTMLPLGVKGILPIVQGKVELFMGVGGAYAWNARRYPGNSWLEQASIGGRIALDRQRRFWVGTTWRVFADLGHTNDRYVTDYNWFTGTADFTFRFGR